MKRNGCARSHVGKVLVEKRWCARHSAEARRLSERSRKKEPHLLGEQHPLYTMVRCEKDGT
jgi:hypothetical protein